MKVGFKKNEQKIEGLMKLENTRQQKRGKKEPEKSWGEGEIQLWEALVTSSE